jgi:hypothetical protein
MPPRPLIVRFPQWFTPEPNTGCWLWTGHLTNAGYGQFLISKRENHRECAHRASWMIYCGPIPNGMSVCHKCDVRSCVNPEHLFLGTNFDNMRDAAAKGRMKWKNPERPTLLRGEVYHQARLTTAAVREIRASTASGVEAARRYGVTPVTISRIRRRIIWKHVA